MPGMLGRNGYVKLIGYPIEDPMLKAYESQRSYLSLKILWIIIHVFIHDSPSWFGIFRGWKTLVLSLLLKNELEGLLLKSLVWWKLKLVVAKLIRSATKSNLAIFIDRVDA